jgi:hypothetical protein
MAISAETPPGYWAARLALLVLRASLPKRPRLDTDSYQLAPSTDTVTADAAARLLAALPKPLRCLAEARERVVHITAGPLVEHSLGKARHLGNEGLLQMVRKRYPEPIDDLIVIWLGREEQLLISVRDTRESLRDYDCSPYGGRAGGWIDDEWAKSQGVTPSRSQGAVAAYKVFPADSGCWFVFVLPRWLARLVLPRLMRRLRPPLPPRDA